MPKNIFLEIEYVGTGYFGFQIQNKQGKVEVTVQEVIEKALARLFNQKIRITFSGRTDRGVHAYAQGVNFKVDTKIPLVKIKRALNSFLPPDVRVKQVKSKPLDFHSRFSVKSKVYRYIILNRPDPSVFWRDFSWHICGHLDLEKMRGVAEKLIGKHDFSLFAKEVKKYKDCARTLNELSLRKRGRFIYIDIEGDGFLRNMARNIASFLVRVGQGNLTLSQAGDILQRKTPYINKSAPAAGLYLYKVRYKR